MEASGVPKAKDQPQVVAWLVVKVTVTLSVPGGSRLLAGARLAMEKPVEEAAVNAGASNSGRLNQIERMNQ
jgi:ABC-type Fe3+ transport system permease subunit